MTEVRTKKSKLDLAFAALLSEDDAQILTALTRIEDQGDARAIKPLLVALTASGSAVVQQRITSMLFQIKVADAVPELLAALDDKNLYTVRTTVLATFWNAGLDVHNHLKRFVDLAIAGTADECFECLTVIENQEIWPEKATRTASTRVKKAAGQEGDAYKRAMLHDLARVLDERLGLGST